MKIDFLILGQGLAGSMLAWELMQRDCKVMIIDNAQENASKVAAGLINPITGMRFAKSTDVDMLLPTALTFYARLANFFGQDFYHEKPLVRIFRSHEELMNCQKRFNQTEYQRYLADMAKPGQHINNISTPFGFLEQKQTGYLATRPLLSSFKHYFLAHQCYRQVEFDYQAIQLSPDLRWLDISPEQIIFCEGYHAGKNPWFSWLPLQAVKGEILTLQHSSQFPDKMLNFGNWLIPVTNQQIRLGASFDHYPINDEITLQARTHLLASLNTITRLDQATVISQQAGIRPCTKDRQPFIGRHPGHPQLAIFNGFGAKGSLQIPWYVQHFADSLLKKTPLLKTCDIQRHEAPFTDPRSSFAH